MKTKRKRRFSIILVGVSVVVGGFVLFLKHRHVQLYKITLLPSLGGKLTTAHLVNDRRQIVGVSEDATGKLQYFFWERDKGMQPLDLGPGLAARDLHLNDLGQITGSHWDPNAGSRAFLWDPTTGKHFLGTPDGTESFASDLNNHGQVVGSAESTAFVWDKAEGMRSLGIPEGFTSSMADIVNDSGQILGYVVSESIGINQVWCFWDSDTGASTQAVTLLPDDNHSIAFDMNNNGHVLGRKHRVEKGEYWTFLWRKDSAIEWLFPLGHPHHSDKLLMMNDANQFLYSEQHVSSLEPLSRKYFPRYTQHCLWDPERGKIILNKQVPPEIGRLMSVADLNNDGCIIVVIRPKGSPDRMVGVLLEPIPERWDK